MFYATVKLCHIDFVIIKFVSGNGILNLKQNENTAKNIIIYEQTLRFGTYCMYHKLIVIISRKPQAQDLK